jgi:DNA helicase II / ATP-dependent DNA helicase PcrA
MDIQAKPPTDEQLAIIDAVRSTKDNLMLEAYAGTGKTHTLELAAKAIGAKPVLYLVFNKKNAEEATSKMPYNVEVRTLNSAGHRAWAGTIYRNLALDFKKSGSILSSMISEAPPVAKRTMSDCWQQVVDGVSLAKAIGYAPMAYPQAQALATRKQFHALLDEEYDELVYDLIDEVLTRSIKAAFEGKIDFNDQVYMPALFKVTCARYPNVLVDEYQDLSPVNHALLSKLVGKRLIGVGDPFQNIYGFRGAKASGMLEAIAVYSMRTLPLSISFRCPSEIVRYVHWRVPAFRWHHEGGFVERPNELAASDIPDDATIICRNNGPLLRTALQFINADRSVNVAGSDIGPRLIGTMRKLGPETLRRAEVFTRIDAWLEAKLAAESKSADDLAECMRCFAERGNDLGQALRYAEHLFAQKGQVYFTTGHKAKGLEWATIVHLDPWLVRRPRPGAKSPAEQNKNLDYVISTRSANRLIEIDSECIIWSKDN